MDVNPINRLENALRDLIEEVLNRKYGADWENHLDCSPGRKAAWEATRSEEQRTRGGILREQRILYYAEFYDLETLVRKHWDDGLGDCFGNQRQTLVYLEKLGSLRNSPAHAREVSPEEEALITGMVAELRQKMATYNAKMREPSSAPSDSELYAHIVSVADNLGNIATGPTDFTSIPLRVGDRLTFHCVAWDPEGEVGVLEWELDTHPDRTYITGRVVDFAVDLTNHDVGRWRSFMFRLYNRNRPYSRNGGERGQDDQLLIRYRVTPR